MERQRSEIISGQTDERPEPGTGYTSTETLDGLSDVRTDTERCADSADARTSLNVDLLDDQLIDVDLNLDDDWIHLFGMLYIISGYIVIG